MGFLRNKIFILIICSIAAFCLVFIGIPKYTAKTKETIQIVRVADNIPQNTLIQDNMLTTVEIGKYNVPNDIIKDKKLIIGKYSAVDLLRTDNLVPSKFKESKSMQDQFLYDINDKVAISISVKSLAAGLSGKLLPGDVVSVLVYRKTEQAYNDQQGYTPSAGRVQDYPNLEYLEVGAVTNNNAQDTDQVKSKNKSGSSSSSSDTIIPTTITLLATKEQAQELVDAENSGNIHIVFRGRDQEAKKLIGIKNNKRSQIDKKATNQSKDGTSKDEINAESKLDKMQVKPSKYTNADSLNKSDGAGTYNLR